MKAESRCAKRPSAFLAGVSIAVVAALAAAPRSLAAGGSPEEEIREALLSREEGLDTWAEGEVDSTVAAIMALQDELHITLTAKQVADICAGFRDSQDFQVSTEYIHPLVRTLNRERFLDAVRTYLADGPADEAARRAAVEQVAQRLNAYKSEAAESYPERAGDMEKAAARTLELVEGAASNPLRVHFLEGARDDIILAADGRWKDSLGGLASVLKQDWRFQDPSSPTSEEYVHIFVVEFYTAIHAIAAAGEQSRPFSEERAKAEAEVSANLSEISEYTSLANRRKMERLEWEMRLRAGAASQDEVTSAIASDLSASLSSATAEQESVEIEAPLPQPSTSAVPADAAPGETRGLWPEGYLISAALVAAVGLLVFLRARKKRGRTV